MRGPPILATSPFPVPVLSDGGITRTTRGARGARGALGAGAGTRGLDMQADSAELSGCLGEVSSKLIS